MFHLAYQTAVWLFAAALVVTTLLPLSASRAWWVRVWDFPRLHSAAFFALIGAVALATPVAGWPVLVAVALAGMLHQGRWILPYTPLVRPEARFAPDDPDGVTLLAANVLRENTRHGDVLATIARTDPDAVLLMEIDSVWDAALEPALARYPTVLREPHDHDHYGLVFATRLPVDDAKLVHLTHDRTPTVVAELRTRAGKPFVFLGLHPQPPVPEGDDAAERDAQIVYAARFARRADVPLVAMGDFNEAAWSRMAQQFKRVGGYVDPRVGRGLYASFDATSWLIRCPIDQIYVTADMAVTRVSLLPFVGSDHFPLLARLRPEPALAATLNVPPKPLDPAEITRLDELVSAYRDRLEKARTATDAARAETSAG